MHTLEILLYTDMASNMRATPNNNAGYDYDFINTPPDCVICKICHLPSREPYLSVCCGFIFCKCCMNSVKASAIANIAQFAVMKNL